ncbi:MAG: hydrolase [Sphingomonas bacterium]|nr:NUDIX hydrolase [Sphingomonas bacterium]MDB5690264.1 hydrolase [Sphingomonas bacterium]
MSPRIIADETVYRGWVSLRRMTVQMPDGRPEERHVEDHGSAVAVLPYDPVRRTALLVSMPRAPVLLSGQPDLLEAIAGRIEDTTPEDTARREAMEEAGVRLTLLDPVANIWTMPSISTERVQLYLAPFGAGDRIAPGGGAADENEGIVVHELTLERLATLADAGDLQDAKTMLLVQALRMRRADLFRTATQPADRSRRDTGA